MFDNVGSIRRGADTSGDIDILATGRDPHVMSTFTMYKLVERMLGHGETKSSVRLWGGIQADLRLVPEESRGAAMQYFTGSKSHNIALRDRAIARGFKLNEYGLFRVDDGSLVAGRTEAEIYDALGLAEIPPELREGRGELEAAERRALPQLIRLEDIRGDIHCHTTETDGRDDIEAMALAARAAGLQYLAITDHSKALAMANGLDEHRALAHARRIREIGDRLDGITLLAGIECDIRADGSMDLADDCLAELDVVVASVHSAFNQDEAQMTDRMLRAISNPFVDIIGHPDRPYSAAARSVQARREPADRRRGRRRRCAGNQLPGPPPRPLRRQRQGGARWRRDHRHQHRLAQQRRIHGAEMGRAGRATGLADEGGCAEYEKRRGVQERAEEKQEA